MFQCRQPRQQRLLGPTPIKSVQLVVFWLMESLCIPELPHEIDVNHQRDKTAINKIEWIKFSWQLAILIVFFCIVVPIVAKPIRHCFSWQAYHELASFVAIFLAKYSQVILTLIIKWHIEYCRVKNKIRRTNNRYGLISVSLKF